MDKVYIDGQMISNMKVSGLKGYNMVREYLLLDLISRYIHNGTVGS